MYDVLPSFVLGFHGCDASIAEAVFSGKRPLKPSKNDYDWLGNGIYFWENNPQRAWEYAAQLKTSPRKRGPTISTPAVVGAVIDMGQCLNLLDHQMIRLVKEAHDALLFMMGASGTTPPSNRGGKDLLQRFLDCAVIEFLHTTREEANERPFDSVRGVFVEGDPIYPGAGFHEKSHIQICVRQPRCIKGYFRLLNGAPASETT